MLQMSESPHESLDQSSTSDEFLDNAGQSPVQVFVKVTLFFFFLFFFQYFFVNVFDPFGIWVKEELGFWGFTLDQILDPSFQLCHDQKLMLDCINDCAAWMRVQKMSISQDDLELGRR